MDKENLELELDFTEIDEKIELTESYLQEVCDELAYECTVEGIDIFRQYTYEKCLPIGEKFTFIDLFDFYFKE